jgi:putative salt-induced outer membrane protein
MFNRMILAIAASVLAATPVLAQTAPKPDGEWRGANSLSATLAGGNTKSTNIGLSADAVRQTKTDKLGFYVQHLYGQANNQVNAQQTRIGGRYDRDITDRLYGFGGLDFEKNKTAGIKLRTLPQMGLGYHVIKSEPVTFDVFAGVAYNNTDKYVDPDQKGITGLIGEESIHKLSPTTTFRQRLVHYPVLSSSGSGDAKLGALTTFDLGLSTAIVGGFNLVANFGARHNDRPGAGKKKTDTLLFTGIQYGWGPK